MLNLNYIISILLTVFGIYNMLHHNVDNVACFVFIGCFGILVQNLVSYLLEIDKCR